MVGGLLHSNITLLKVGGPQMNENFSRTRLAQAISLAALPVAATVPTVSFAAEKKAIEEVFDYFLNKGKWDQVGYY